MARLARLLALVLSIGCGSPSVDTPDASTDERVRPPAPAEAAWMQCPPGWSATDDAIGCHPWPSGELTECADGEARFPGRDECEPLGAVCPAGEYAEDLPSSGVRYVSRSGTSEGDGSMERPFDSIARALEDAREGTFIAVGAGTFAVGFLELGPGVTLAGACASRTTIRTEHLEPGRALVAARSGMARIRDITLGGSLLGVVATGAGTTLDLRGVVVDAPRGIGVLALSGALVAGEGVMVRDVRPGSDGNAAGLATQGGIIDLARVRVERVPGISVFATGAGSQLRARDAHLRDTQANAGAGGGYALSAQQGASVQLERTLIEGGLEVGIKIADPETRVVLTDVVVRDASAPGRATGGAGLAVGTGATLEPSASSWSGRRTSGCSCSMHERGEACDEVQRLEQDGFLKR
jgi:hypothetical protein